MVKAKLDSKDFERSLTNLAAVLNDRQVEKALLAGGHVFKNAAQDNAPIDKGHLRRSIHVGGYGKNYSDSNDPSNDYVDIGGNGRVGDEIQLLIGTSIDYSAIVEYGGQIPTNASMIAKLRYLGYKARSTLQYVTVVSQPYFRPAFNSSWRAAFSAVRNALRTMIQRGVS